MEYRLNHNGLPQEDAEIRDNVKRLGPANIKYLGEPHVACCLLADTSDVMRGCGIQQLNDALARFREQVCRDELSAMRVDVCLIEFNSDVRVAVPFCPITEFEPPTLRAGGEASMGRGIRYALEAVHEQVHAYHVRGIECYKPFVLMITGGRATDDLRGIAELIRARENEGRYGHLRFHALGVGNADMHQLMTLTNRVMAVDGYNLEGAFKWIIQDINCVLHTHRREEERYPSFEPFVIYPGKDRRLPWED